MNSVELSKLATKVKFNTTFFMVREVRGKRQRGVRFKEGNTETINALLAKNLVSAGICSYKK